MHIVLKFVKSNWKLLLILLLGAYLRMYKAVDLLPYGHDQDLEGWFVIDVLKNGHFRLVGQETSTKGIFIGSLYYYFLTFFYFLFKMSPLGGIYLELMLGMFTISSFYYVLLKIFKKQSIANIAAFVYSVSYFTVTNDRGVYPTSPVILWTVWYLYGLYLLLQGNKKSLILIPFLIGIIWHLNVTLVLLLLFTPLAIFLSEKKYKLAEITKSLVYTGIFTSPFWLFELRHGFIQTKSLILSFTQNQGSPLAVADQFKRVLGIFFQNVTTLIFFPDRKYNAILPIALYLYLFYLIAKKYINKKIGLLLFLWPVIIIGFFSLYSKVVSEYYLHGLMVVFIVLLVHFFHQLLSQRNTRLYGGILILVFSVLNISKLFNYHNPQNGYIPKMQLIQFISSDLKKWDYPCFAISYITDPGYDFGYRYLFYINNLHVNKPSSGSPVYTIVFPLDDKLFPVDKTFGSLGLIFPDHERYNKDSVRKSCLGDNPNLTEPMWGFPN